MIGSFSLKSNLAYIDGVFRDFDKRPVDATDGFEQFKPMTSPTTIMEECPLDPSRFSPKYLNLLAITLLFRSGRS